MHGFNQQLGQKRRKCDICGKFLTENEIIKSEELSMDCRSDMGHTCEHCLS